LDKKFPRQGIHFDALRQVSNHCTKKIIVADKFSFRAGEFGAILAAIPKAFWSRCLALTGNLGVRAQKRERGGEREGRGGGPCIDGRASDETKRPQAEEWAGVGRVEEEKMVAWSL
jgi:hypothetical protein